MATDKAWYRLERNGKRERARKLTIGEVAAYKRIGYTVTPTHP